MRRAVLTAIMAVLATLATACPPQPPGPTGPPPVFPPGVTRLTTTLDGGETTEPWFQYGQPSVSADGRFVAFDHPSPDLVEGDTNGRTDAFVHDRVTGVTTRVSVRSDGVQASGQSSNPSISADGRFVAFESSSTNLHDGPKIQSEVYVHDRQTGVTQKVSNAIDGTQANSYSRRPAISADGTKVAFWSNASNLADAPDHPRYDLFVHDLATGETVPASNTHDGGEPPAGHRSDVAPAISADGRYVAFSSHDDRLVPGPYTGYEHIYVRDLHTGEIARADVNDDGEVADRMSLYPRLSGDGRYVVFSSYADNLDGRTSLSDVFLHDRLTGTTRRVGVASDGTPANRETGNGAISADGRYVVFSTDASNLIPGNTRFHQRLYLRDLETGDVEPMPPAVEGFRPDGVYARPVLSADVGSVVFWSTVTNLVPGDTNGRPDLFVYDIE